MYLNLASSTKFIRLQALNAAIGGNATVVIYDGLYPATPDNPPLANSLAVFACDPAAFGTVAAQAMVIGNSIATVATLVSLAFPPVLCGANGVAGWARISNAGGNAIVDLDVAQAGGNTAGGNTAASIVMNSTDLIANIPVQIVSIILSEQ